MTTTTGAPRALVAETDTLIVSDLHLGLPVSRPRELLHLLETWRFNRLILLGDVVHDLGSRDLCADTLRLLRHVRALGARRGAEVVWIAGNHDRRLAPLVRTRLGIEVREEFAWTCGGRRYHAQHGDRFDAFVSRHVRLSGLVARLGSCRVSGWSGRGCRRAR
jgi:metallophosphoesterase superfamily enzyme